MFDKHLSGDDLATAPKFCVADNGTSYWEYQGMKMPVVGLNAVVGRPLEEYGMEPTALEQLREGRSEEHTSELQSLMRISYAVFCLKQKKNTELTTRTHQ